MRLGPGARRLPQAPPGSAVPSRDLSSAFDRAGRRDSDAASISSLPSNASTVSRISNVSCAIIVDRAAQISALSDLNAYLSNLNAPFSLRADPLPSTSDIISIFRFLLSHLDFSLSDKAVEDDILSFLSVMKCPVKMNRSNLKAPGTPHVWPKILTVLYWLAQLTDANYRLAEAQPPSNDLVAYLNQSYSLFLSGDDDAVQELDREYATKIQEQAAVSAEQAEGMEKEIADLEKKLAAIVAANNGPSLREELEKKRELLMGDKKKFETVVENWTNRLSEHEETRKGLENELEAKKTEHKRLLEKKDELEKRIGMQGVSVRDVERMKREIQALERDIEEAKNGKSVAEEKVWEVEAGIAQKLDQMEVSIEQGNLLIKR